jgi:subtilisin family serine protease
MKRISGWLTPLAALLGLALAGPLVEAAPRANGNALGVVVVRFKAGVGADQMRAAIALAGGEVVTDLSKLHRMTAVSPSKGFAAAVRANPLVAGAAFDKVYSHGKPDAAAEDAGVSVNRDPQLGSPGPNGPPDPWHNLGSFLGETNPEGILQWDDRRMNVPAAWATTTGDRDVRVAVIDTGVQGSHKELLANYDNRHSANTIPCRLLTRQFGPLGQMDCSSEDTEGHGTWVASRIAGAANGFASNGVAPKVQIIGYKALSTTLGGGLTSWITDAMVRACDAGADLINMSLGGYDSVDDAEDYLLWVDAVNYCRAKGTAIFASAGNEHVRVHRVDLTIGGRALSGVGKVDAGDEGILSIIPGDTIENNDLRGLLETPAGVPGVVMVSATNNAIGGTTNSPAINANARALVWPDAVAGARDQLTYYSSYGARIDIAAPGGARKFNMPRADVGAADILYGGWGTLGALDASGEICTDPASASLLTFACFKVNGNGFGWLQGTSMSSPNATGVAALVLSAKPSLRKNPDALLARLQSTARTDMVNLMGPNDPDNHAPGAAGSPDCKSGWCHIDRDHPISFSDAYGAGIVDAGAAVAP